MKIKGAGILCLFAALGAAQPAPAGPLDPALAEKLCQDLRKNAPEDRAHCDPKEYVTITRTQLYHGAGMREE